MKPNALAQALAITAGIAYILCSLVVVFIPGTAIALYSALTHMQKVELGTITFASFALGFVQVILYSYLVGFIFGAVYTKRAGN